MATCPNSPFLLLKNRSESMVDSIIMTNTESILLRVFVLFDLNLQFIGLNTLSIDVNIKK